MWDINEIEKALVAHVNTRELMSCKERKANLKTPENRETGSIFEVVSATEHKMKCHVIF